jgi:hypothetical protein
MICSFEGNGWRISVNDFIWPYKLVWTVCARMILFPVRVIFNWQQRSHHQRTHFNRSIRPGQRICSQKVLLVQRLISHRTTPTICLATEKRFLDNMSGIRNLRGLYHSFSQSFGNSMLFNLSKFYFLSVLNVVGVQ